VGLLEKYWIVVENKKSFMSKLELGLHRNKVKLLPHNSNWNNLFIQEKNNIEKVLGDEFTIEHIGSTAVPNIHAKPIIGILVGCEKEIDQKNIIKKLARIGYKIHKKEAEAEPTFFIKALGENSFFHLHLTVKNSLQWSQALGFRDCLIKNPDLAKEYEILKIELAKKYPNDRKSYKEGKQNFITNILRKLKNLIVKTS
jgi:GrpB-like predicted nucleotidyltransferase (UPF0157 family)